MRETFGILGGIVGVSVLLHYAWQVMRGKAEAASIATWFMWTILDVLLLTTTHRAGKPIWLPLGWTIGALLVTGNLMKSGTWVWSWKETLSLICTVNATIVWRTQGAELGVVAGTVALTCAGIPLLIDMVRMPLRSTFHVWFVTCIACTLTLLASDGSFAGTFLAFGSLAYNGTLSILSLRQPQRLVNWDMIKNHLEPEGLDLVIDRYPKLREEAITLAKPKRLVSKLMEAVKPQQK